ncbi:methylcrotonoyl-CoA carboxylase subunit alpha, mitochondrial-like [Ananas comosus]|uniref:Methylcrotonoyl-CoA carboxylase subunit alpha, mitochondrial-like n=1 Tax=Ananas comosus TaxID=4615 RepID=A0A6P5FVS4_ANACO|nr:methylcrotonoyl-CoA carboxylase subunit alpha, mitochondrial-like [Ananas comosus]
MHYDPMIAKLVVWGETRNAALVKLKSCLLNFQIEDSNSPALDVKAVRIGNNYFRVEAGGLHMNVTLASYSKEGTKLLSGCSSPRKEFLSRQSNRWKKTCF